MRVHLAFVAFVAIFSVNFQPSESYTTTLYNKSFIEIILHYICDFYQRSRPTKDCGYVEYNHTKDIVFQEGASKICCLIYYNFIRIVYWKCFPSTYNVPKTVTVTQPIRGGPLQVTTTPRTS